MIIRDNPNAPWRVHGRADTTTGASTETPIDVGSSESLAGRKRALSSSETAGEGTKRARTEPSEDGTTAAPNGSQSSAPPCLAPAPDPTAHHVLSCLSNAEPDASLGAGDIFLAGEWRDRWCKCDKCMVELRKDPYLLVEEETYEPPEDPDSGLSLDQLGMQALNRLPRDKVIDGIRAFNDMRYAFSFTFATAQDI